MSITINIVVPEEIKVKLDKEENKSGLIQGLLREHYREQLKSTLTWDELERERCSKVEIIKKEVETIEEKKEAIIKDNKEKEEQQANLKKKEEYKVIAIQKFFSENLGRPLSDPELSDYLQLFERGETTAWQYQKEIMRKSKPQ